MTNSVNVKRSSGLHIPNTSLAGDDIGKIIENTRNDVIATNRKGNSTIETFDTNSSNPKKRLNNH